MNPKRKLTSPLEEDPPRGKIATVSPGKPMSDFVELELIHPRTSAHPGNGDQALGVDLALGIALALGVACHGDRHHDRGTARLAPRPTHAAAIDLHVVVRQVVLEEFDAR